MVPCRSRLSARVSALPAEGLIRGVVLSGPGPPSTPASLQRRGSDRQAGPHGDHRPPTQERPLEGSGSALGRLVFYERDGHNI